MDTVAIPWSGPLRVTHVTAVPVKWYVIAAPPADDWRKLVPLAKLSRTPVHEPYETASELSCTVVEAALTVTRAWPVSPLYVADMLAAPLPRAVARPELETVATA